LYDGAEVDLEPFVTALEDEDEPGRAGRSVDTCPPVFVGLASNGPPERTSSGHGARKHA
jgi:hypothetical protein